MNITLESFLFDIPLYTEIEIHELKEYLSVSRDIEGYNSFRKVTTTFSLYNRSYNFYESGYGRLEIACRRYGDVFTYFCWWDAEKKMLMKIGQYPSVADIHIGQIKQYDKLLTKEKLKEFTRAVGLAANGVGIGSFVYLRRIFEHLINEAYVKSSNEKKVDEPNFQKIRMDDKIELLKNYLPSFLVQNRSIYKILSKGIHELDENTCLAHFDTLKVGIEIILDEKLEEAKKRKKIEDANKKLQQLNQAL